MAQRPRCDTAIGESGSTLTGTLADNHETPRSNHVAGHGLEAAERAEPVPAKLQPRIAGDRENGGRTDAVNLTGAQGQNLCAPIVKLSDGGPKTL